MFNLSNEDVVVRDIKYKLLSVEKSFTVCNTGPMNRDLSKCSRCKVSLLMP